MTSKRESLTARRSSETVSLTFNLHRHDFGIARFEDGRPAEVFAYAFYGKGAAEEVYARDASIILSLALQHGTPIETIQKALTRDDRGLPCSLIGAIVEAVVKLSETSSPGLP